MTVNSYDTTPHDGSVHHLLKTYFGYTSFRENQFEIIQSILAGNDSFVLMPTGGGKSLCYQIPAPLLDGLTLVISPLIALMKDQVDKLVAIGYPATFLNSSLLPTDYDERINDIVRGKYCLIYLSPEGLVSPLLKRMLDNCHIAHLAVDEAHCISNWGHDFRLAYRQIASFIDNLPQRPVISAFTATATPKVQDDIIRNLQLNQPEIFKTGFHRPNLSFHVISQSKKADFIYQQLAKRRQQSGIIYCATRNDTEKIYAFFKRRHYPIGYYHAGLNHYQRHQMQEAFLTDKIKLMVATNAFGMGIDKPNIRYVIHYQLPASIEAYYQEAGRAGRDGLPADCYLLYAPKDVHLRRYMIEQDNNLTTEQASRHYLKLHQMQAYCTTKDCLTNALLNYFGENSSQTFCGQCNHCLTPYSEEDRTLEAMMVIRCVLSINQHYGPSTIALILRGSTSKKINHFRHLESFGQLKNWSAEQTRTFIQSLINQHYLYISHDAYPVVMVTQSGHQLLDGKESFILKQILPIQPKEDGLLTSLTTFRRKQATIHQLPAYMILSDNVLQALNQQRPSSTEQLLSIRGIGPQKARQFGPDILRLIANYHSSKGEKR